MKYKIIRLIRKYIMKLSNIFYEVKCFFKPYNVVRIQNLPRTWCDRDWLMFHAMFQILVDFVELEHPFTHDYSMKKRFTDRGVMREMIEKRRTQEYIEANYYYENITEDGKIKASLEAISRYIKDFEMYEVYEWYKDKKYEFKLDEHIPIEEYIDRENAHELECDKMLHKILTFRKHLWT